MTTRELRLDHGLTQAEFASACFVSVKLVQAWEAGTRTPSPLMMRLIELTFIGE